MRRDPGDQGVAAADHSAVDFVADQPFAAVKAVTPGVAIAGLSPAILLNRNPGLGFRAHSFLDFSAPPPPWDAPSHHRRIIGARKARGISGPRRFAVKAMERLAKINWRG
jgi:hypothetical protein